MVTAKKVSKKTVSRKASVPSDVSRLVLEHHAKQLGMSFDELLNKLASVEGATTADKLRKIYDEVGAQRRAKRMEGMQEIVLGKVYLNNVFELRNRPGRYTIVADILNPLADSEDEMFLPGLVPGENNTSEKNVILFASEAVKDRILSAPLGATLLGRMQYDENYGNWTVSVSRVYKPKPEYLDKLCDAEALDVDWYQFDPKDRFAGVYFYIDPSKFDVDTVFKETRDGSPMVKVVAPYEGGFLTINIFDVDHLPGDPWTEWKSYPKVYAYGRLYRVRDGSYDVSVSRVFVPVDTEVDEEADKDSVADRIVEYLQGKSRPFSTAAAIAKALGIEEGDVIAIAKEDARLDVDEDGIVTLKE